MILQTRHFGEIDIEESKILSFHEGLPGFEDVKKYTLLCGEDARSPFKWLQSVDAPKLAFAMVDPFAIKKDYEININNDVLINLGVENPEDVLVYSIVVVPDEISKTSMNLKAPVIINKKSNKGMQVILDTDKYSVRHYIMEELGEVCDNACSDKEEGSVHCTE